MRPIFEAALTALLAKRFRSFPRSFTTLTGLYHAAPVPHNFASQILRAILFAARLLSSTMHLIWTTSSRVRLAKLLEVSQQKFMVRIVYMVCVCVRVRVPSVMVIPVNLKNPRPANVLCRQCKSGKELLGCNLIPCLARHVTICSSRQKASDSSALSSVRPQVIPCCSVIECDHSGSNKQASCGTKALNLPISSHIFPKLEPHL